ncbi:integrase catalytic domain-containing protein [Trichonephila clavipes]|nr:integrase catalytic domain-containing protein [Trichonephila clavipes]
MDQIDAFPEHISTTVMPVFLPEKPYALEYAARQGQIRACIIYQDLNTKHVFNLLCKDNWLPKKTLLDNFKRAIMEVKQVKEFRPHDVLWEKISKGLLRNPDRPLRNTNKRMVYIYNNMFFCEKNFTFGFRTVKSSEIHLIQSTNVPMRIYEFPSSSLRCRDNPNLLRRSFEPFDQMLYHRMVLEPHTAYPILAGTRYILLTVQKTVFGLNIIPETILPLLIENGFNLGDFRKMCETVRSKDLQATSSYPGSCTYRDKQTTFGRTARAFFQEVCKQSVYPTHHLTICGSCVDRQNFNCLGLPSTRDYSRASDT